MGFCRDGRADPRSAGVPASAARGLRHQPARQHHHHRREARQSLAEQPLPALRSEIHQRIVFADSVAAGRLARETAPDSAAAREIAALTDELLRWPT
jgi:cellulose biosynthesis protein BcsQ